MQAMIYHSSIEGASPLYDFRRDFRALARPGRRRFLDVSAEVLGDEFDGRRAAYAKCYVRDVWRALKSLQSNAEYGEPWNAERAAEIAAEFESDTIESQRRAADTTPVDIDRAVRLGTELARKQGLDVGADAVAYATDGLRSKIERDAVYNPVTAVYSAFMSYAFLKKQRGGRSVTYLHRHRALDVEPVTTAPEADAADNVVEFPAPKAAPKVEAVRPVKAPKFALTWAADMNLGLNEEWLFKGLVPRVGVVSVFGDSRSFKTFLLVHMSILTALGRDFAGRRCKNRGAVVYISAEDPKGVEKRIIGYCAAHGIPRAEVFVAAVGVSPSLGTTKGDAVLLGQEVAAQIADKGLKSLSAIVIDTLNQTLGDAEENGTGMQAFMINANLLANGFGCAVYAANHVGHAEKDRERGGSQIKGNADTRLQVERLVEAPTIVAGVKTFETLIHARKVKNGEDGFSLRATLREFVLGVDEDGDEAKTLVIDRVEAASEPREEATSGGPGSPGRVSKTERTRRAFTEAYHHLANDVEPSSGLDGKSMVRKVRGDAIRDHMRDSGMLDCEDGKPDVLTNGAKELFNRVKRELIAPGLWREFIELRGLVWALFPPQN